MMTMLWNEVNKMGHPKKLEKFIHALMEEVRKGSVLKLMDDNGVNEEELEEIDEWFWKEFRINL